MITMSNKWLIKIVNSKKLRIGTHIRPLSTMLLERYRSLERYSNKRLLTKVSKNDIGTVIKILSSKVISHINYNGLFLLDNCELVDNPLINLEKKRFFEKEKPENQFEIFDNFIDDDLWEVEDE